VAEALKAGQPVVALSSAPLAHSLPWPANLETARQAEAAAREEGGVLAVVAVWQGRLTVGLQPREVEALASGASSFRASRHDLAGAVVKGKTAATTGSSTMYLASRAGIRLLVASAVGSTVREAERSWDVSADLVELSRTPVGVVCAGGRSVLALNITLEILESLGVPVAGYRTESFPHIYLHAGGPPASVRVDTPAEAAAVLAAHWGMNGGGVLLANPTPEEVALSPDELHDALASVEKQVGDAHERGRDLPPVLMTRLNRLTGGKTLRAYQAIIVANTRLAIQVARELGKTGN
jgi:pseudouridine-5'-phosphate glycosidase